MTELNASDEKKKVILSLVFPLFFLIIIWTVKIVELTLHIDLGFLGIYPLRASGLIGIITAPLIHGSIQHLINNSVPLFVLSWGIFYFYNKIAFRVFFLVYFITGIWVWIGARSAYHIGASGLIYGFGSFLFFSGIIRRNINLLAISLLVAFLYGSMVWGIFPVQETVSWESHLMGGLAGIVLAIYYRREGPPKKPAWWEDEEDDDPLEEIIVADEDNERNEN